MNRSKTIDDLSDDALHAVDLLAQEDVHGQEGTHAFQRLLDLVVDVVARHLLRQVVDHAVHHRFARLAVIGAAALLGLHAQDRVQDFVRSGTRGRLSLASFKHAKPNTASQFQTAAKELS